MIADTYLQNNHFDKALTILDLILSLFEGDPHALLCKAYCFIQQSRVNEALAIVETLDTSGFDESEKAALALIKGRGFYKVGDDAKAKAFTKEFLALRASLEKVKQVESA